METTETKKQLFIKRFTEKYPDVDIQNEDSYYDQANRLMDDYENYENATRNLIEALDGNEEFMEMLTQACTQQDFDPVVWMVEKRGLDLQEAMQNPDYAAVIAKAHSKYLEEEAAKRDIDNEMKTNLPESLKLIDEKAKQLDINDEEKNQLIALMLQMGEDMVKGILSDKLFEMIARGKDFDSKMEEAREQGRQEGLNTRIDEHLRTIHSTPITIQPTQKSPSQQTHDIPKPKNPFIDADWK